jgi:hypothetical protein
MLAHYLPAGIAVKIAFEVFGSAFRIAHPKNSITGQSWRYQRDKTVNVRLHRYEYKSKPNLRHPIRHVLNPGFGRNTCQTFTEGFRGIYADHRILAFVI